MLTLFGVVGQRDRARLPDLSLAVSPRLSFDLFLDMPQRSHAEVCDCSDQSGMSSELILMVL